MLVGKHYFQIKRGRINSLLNLANKKFESRYLLRILCVIAFNLSKFEAAGINPFAETQTFD